MSHNRVAHLQVDVLKLHEQCGAGQCPPPTAPVWLYMHRTFLQHLLQDQQSNLMRSRELELDNDERQVLVDTLRDITDCMGYVTQHENEVLLVQLTFCPDGHRRDT